MAKPEDAAFASSPDVLTQTAQGRLRTIVERVERLEEDKAAIAAARAAGGYLVRPIAKGARDRLHRREDVERFAARADAGPLFSEGETDHD